jgi:phosphatidylglycerol:prolipoprotein diacylglycerol transferase
MIIHNFDPVLLDLGFIQIKWYSLAYILGIILGWIFAVKIIKKTQNNKYNFTQITKEDFDDLVVYLVFGIILGGRLGYVFFYNFEYYNHNYLEILKLWQGGMSFHGGLLGVIVAIYIFSIKKNINFFKISDIVSCVAPIGIFLVRIANFINGELYGKITSVTWGVVFKSGGNVTRHPSQIYEAILEGILLFIIINYLAFRKELIFKTGYISVLFLILYSVLRIFSEFFREPDNHLGYLFSYLSLGTLLSFITLSIGLLIFLVIKKNEQNN